jgi:hypothetical protein
MIKALVRSGKNEHMEASELLSLVVEEYNDITTYVLPQDLFPSGNNYFTIEYIFST